MRINSTCTVVSLALLTMLLSLGGGIAFAADDTTAPMTPQLAAKGARVKTQQAQRITPAQRQAAADSLKERRLKLHQGRQAVPQPAPQTAAPATVTQ